MSRSILSVTLALGILVPGTSLVAGEKGDRDQAMALLTGADALVTSGDHAKAIEMCKRALAADALCPAAYFKMGQCQEHLNKSRDAFKSYKTASDLAKKENDAVMQRKAYTAAEKLGAGLIQISEADAKLIVKLLPLADEALADEQLETAKSAYAAILALQPTHDKAREGLDKAEKAIEARGDPVKAKIAAAMLAEVYYLNNTGDKAAATKMAVEITSRHAGTSAGKDAAQLLANDFGPPKNIDAEIAEAKRVLKEQAQRAKKVAAAVKTTTPTPGAGSGSASTASPTAPVDVDAWEKVAMADAKSMAKDKLVPSYKETYAKGKDFFAKARPGSEGNQKNLHAALEQFIRCEALYMRIEEEKLNDGDIDAMQKQAGTSRYSCMKMTILAH